MCVRLYVYVCVCVWGGGGGISISRVPISCVQLHLRMTEMKWVKGLHTHRMGVHTHHTHTYLHVIEDEEQCFYRQSLEEVKGVQVRGRVLMVVEGSGTRCSLDVRSKSIGTLINAHHK